MDTKAKITKLLNDKLQITHLEILDDSHKHVGHGAPGKHFTIRISAKEFADKTHIQRHRLIYQILSDLLKKEIHALAIEIQS